MNKALLSLLACVALSMPAHARFLSGQTGRFLTADIEEGDEARPASANRYIYGEADPVNNTDPSGNRIHPMDAVAGGVIKLIRSIQVTGQNLISWLEARPENAYVWVKPTRCQNDAACYGRTRPRDAKPVVITMGPAPVNPYWFDEKPAKHANNVDVFINPQSFISAHAPPQSDIRLDDVAVHELVHVFQAFTGAFDPNSSQSEYDARAVQYMYRLERGTEPAANFFWLAGEQPFLGGKDFNGDLVKARARSLISNISTNYSPYAGPSLGFPY